MERGHKWKKPSPELGKLLEAALLRFTYDRKIMFGAPVFMINRNMFAGVHEDHIFIRLSESDRKELLMKVPGANQFEPLKGHIMKEYMVVPKSLYEDQSAFTPWLKRAHDFAASLPAKAKKSRK